MPAMTDFWCSKRGLPRLPYGRLAMTEGLECEPAEGGLALNF